VAFAPVIAKTATVRRFDSLQRWQTAIDFADAQADGATGFETRIAANKRDFEARFGKAQCLMARQQWTAAMDELLEILMRDKAWSEDLARKTYIAILDVIEPPKLKVADGQIPPDDPVVATYRRRLSSVVLSYAACGHSRPHTCRGWHRATACRTAHCVRRRGGTTAPPVP
jgi:putative thioredoxin